MTTRSADAGPDPLIESRDDLLGVFAGGEKPKERWRIGTEHEKFVFRHADRGAPSYEERGGIHALLIGMTKFGWEPVYEGDKIIALAGEDGAISLEPAGQFELSGAPLATLHETADETDRHLAQVREIGDRLGLGFLGLGFWPDKARAELPVMPKGRYDIMRRHMPRVGSLGLDMMLRTCTIQTNLDYRSEADMVCKFRVSLALQPLATALFANSPFTEGRPNGFLSYRSHIWTDTDPQRTGMLPFVFEDGFGYERYAEYMLDVPMYFVFRDGRYVDAAGLSFRDFLDGRLSVLPGERPRVEDWKDHLSTAFPEVRLKSFLEMRGADGGPRDMIVALPAFWVGLLYDDDALAAAWDEVRHWTIEDHHRIREQVPRLGLATRGPRGRSFRELARVILDISRRGLAARARRNVVGEDETRFLTPLDEIVADGRVPAEQWLARYEAEWGGELLPIYEAARY